MASDPNQQQNANFLYLPIAEQPLDWDQRHKIAGGFYLGGDTWGASTRVRLQSGFPYDPSFPEAAIVGNDVQPEFAENSRRMPSALLSRAA